MSGEFFMSELKAVITAGGKGVRLRPITDSLPKPLVPLAGKECIVRAAELLMKYGITEIAVTTMFMGEKIKECLENRFPNVSFTFFNEETPLGTAGSVGAARDFFDGDFIVMSGDCLCDLDIADAVNFHKEKNGTATVILAERDDPTEYGTVITDEKNRVCEFVEKPDWSRVFTTEINAGIYIFKKEIFDFIPENVPFDFSKDLFPLLLKKHIPIYAKCFDFYWEDIGTCEKFLRANRDILNGKVRDCKFEKPEDIPEAKIVSPCVIGKNCRIGKAEIGPFSVIGDGCIIEDGAKIDGSVLFDGVSVGKNAFIRRSVLCERSAVGENSSVGDGSVIGKKTAVGAGSVVSSGSVVSGGCSFAEGSSLSGRIMSAVGRPDIICGGFDLQNGLSDALRWGYACGRTFDGNIALALPKKAYTAAAQTFSSAVRDCGSNVYLLVRTDLSALKYIVRNFGFQGGVYMKDGGATLVDEDGLLISPQKAKTVLSKYLSRDFIYGGGGKLKVFDGFLTVYGHHLSQLFGENLSDYPSFTLKSGEKAVLSGDKLKIFTADGGEYSENDVRLACFYAFGKRRKKVFIPEYFSSVAEKTAAENGFTVRRISFSDGDRYLMYNFLDPVFCAAELMSYISESGEAFRDILRRFPEISVSAERLFVGRDKARIISELSSLPGAKRRFGAIRISSPQRGNASIFPTADRRGFKITAEAANAETARALCEFYVNKIKTVSEKVKNDTTE